jgi:hypothetical protein
MRTQYIAFDGEEFNSEKECLDYERNLKEGIADYVNDFDSIFDSLCNELQELCENCGACPFNGMCKEIQIGINKLKVE